jgi:hypothetical protein
MKLEQWEIDLQNQLQRIEPDVIKTIPEVQSEVVVPNIPTSTPKDPEDNVSAPISNDKSSTMQFLLLLVILFVATLFVYDHKTGGKLKTWVLSHFSNRIEKVEKIDNKKPNDSDLIKLRSDFEKFTSENKTQLDALTNKVGSTRDKVMLMGLLLNENFNIVKQGENKEEMVFFNRDWTLDRMPTHIELSDEDREYLKKYIK